MIPSLEINSSPLELLDHPVAQTAGVRLYVKRDDLYSPAPGTALQGNKVRKLAGLLHAALASAEKPLLVSFGGAYSNHLSALATAGRLYGLPVLIYVRGEEVQNPLLAKAEAEGAKLMRLSRATYRKRNDEDWLANQRIKLAQQYEIPVSQVWFIAEGGTCPGAIRSVSKLYAEVVGQLGEIPEFMALSAGTGGTAAGLILAASPKTQVEVFPALKGKWMTQEISKWLPKDHPVPWSCISDYHFGGYGKFPPEWIVDAPGLAKRASIGPGLPPLEPIYTAKLFYGVLDRIRQGVYSVGSTIVVVHTGGIY